MLLCWYDRQMTMWYGMFVQVQYDEKAALCWVVTIMGIRVDAEERVVEVSRLVLRVKERRCCSRLRLHSEREGGYPSEKSTSRRAPVRTTARRLPCSRLQC